MSASPQGKELMELLLGSETKGELLMLFHRNPGIVDSMEGVARRIGRRGDQIESDVRDFVELGLLRKTSAGKIELLAFREDRDREIQASMTNYIRGAVQ